MNLIDMLKEQETATKKINLQKRLANLPINVEAILNC